MKKLFYLFLAGIFLNVFPLRGEDSFPAVDIVASRIASFPGTIIISAGEIEKMPGNSVSEIIRYAAGVDIQMRESFGGQGDVTFLGSTFEEVAVLVDGVKMNDRQTGHHNLNLPLSKENIERIEILTVPAASLYGSGAFAGTINIVTKKRRENLFSLNLGAFEKNTFSNSTSYGLNTGKLSIFMQEEKNISQGYYPGRDFRNSGYYGKISYSGKARLGLQYGRQDKDFGAAHFYSLVTENEREVTQSDYFLLDIEHPLSSNLFLTSKSSLRAHDDEFSYNFGSGFYRNLHKNRRRAEELSLRYAGSGTAMNFGGEFVSENMASNALKNETQTTAAFFAGLRRKTGKHEPFINARRDHNSEWDNKDSISLGDTLGTASGKLHILFATAFRPPSYTELKYWDPGNEGNEALHLEKSRYYEIGCEIKKWICSLFLREGRDIIDWVKFKEGDPWKSWNVPVLDMKGAGLEKEFFVRENRFKAGYVFLDSKTGEEYFDSKYAFNYPRHQVNFSFFPCALKGWESSLSGVYKKRRDNQEAYLISDMRISKKIRSLEIYFEGLNLFDERVEEVEGVKTSGRWLGAGVKVSL